MCINLSDPTKFWENFTQKFSLTHFFGKYFEVEGADSKNFVEKFLQKK
jgi:hypothetical protein